MTLLVIEARLSNLWLASWHNVIVMTYSSAATMADFPESLRVTESVLKRHPRYGTIAIADSKVGLPDAETRKRSSQEIERASAKSTCMAIVLEGDGFWQAASRAAMAGMLMVTQNSVPTKIFATAHEAALWVPEHMGITPRPDGEELSKAIAEMRAEQLALARPEKKATHKPGQRADGFSPPPTTSSTRIK